MRYLVTLSIYDHRGDLQSVYRDEFSSTAPDQKAEAADHSKLVVALIDEGIYEVPEGGSWEMEIHEIGQKLFGATGLDI